MRRQVAETRLHPASFVLPLFVVPGSGVANPIRSMPGHSQLSVDELLPVVKEAASVGVGGVMLFGIPESKDEIGSGAWDPAGPVPEAIRAIKGQVDDIAVWADVCLCEYTSHGHCGVIEGEAVDNDQTLPLLARASSVYADAGADVIAPSDMMDGRVGAIRAALEDAGHCDTAIMAYAAKYASAFYGPFRDAVGSGGRLKGDKRSYQMDPANADEALREVALDIAEGADMVMVKPGLPYLDVIWRVRERFGVPTFAYQVSGEYAMIEHAASAGAGNREALIVETLLAFKRAGATGILTYHAVDAARLIHG